MSGGVLPPPEIALHEPSMGFSTALLEAMEQYCCKMMEQQLEQKCSVHSTPMECPDFLVHYSAKFDSYSLIIHDGGGSTITISFCPWCGAKLPDKSDRWFQELEALGFDEPFEQDIPERYRSDAWYRF